MRRFTLSTRMQVSAVAAAGLAMASGVAGLAAVAASAPAMSQAVSTYASRSGEVSAMQARVSALQAEVATIRSDAKAHAKRLEARQAFLAGLLNGDGNVDAHARKVSAAEPAKSHDDVHAWFQPVEAQQHAIESKAKKIADARYLQAVSTVARLGIDPRRLQLAVGGPYEPVATATTPTTAQSGAGQPLPTVKADPQFKALFNSWKRLDQMQQGMVSIPSVKPVPTVSINSGFGVRRDPFRGGAAMHAGVDIPGPIGTPIYATADGIIGRSGWVSGYGKLIELEHGRGIQTRYGHLSQINVAAGTRVKRGQLIGLMGSTGRSTGSHLHYEVRLDGRAVNPLPFLRSNDYLVAMQQKTQAAATALGGPNKSE